MRPPSPAKMRWLRSAAKTPLRHSTLCCAAPKPGQELKAEVIYPADYAEPKLAGKTVAYDVTVKGIKKRILPELTDDFAKEIGSYENLAELETRVREHMANRKRRAVGRNQGQALCGARREIRLPRARVAGAGAD